MDIYEYVYLFIFIVNSKLYLFSTSSKGHVSHKHLFQQLHSLVHPGVLPFRTDKIFTLGPILFSFIKSFSIVLKLLFKVVEIFNMI